MIKSIGVEDLAGFLLFHIGSRVLDPTTFIRIKYITIDNSRFRRLIEFRLTTM